LSTVVIDSSALIDMLFHRHPSAIAGRGMHEFVAPELIVPEVVNATRRLSRANPALTPEFERMLRAYGRVGIQYFPHDPLMPVAWELRHNFSAYDAMYVALAQRLGLPLVTSDRRLARAARGECDVLELDDLLVG
jgi:predicted nucleic acid-binding protein